MALKLWGGDQDKAGGNPPEAAGQPKEAAGQPKEAGQGITDADLATLSKQLHAIAENAVMEHNRWSQGFLEWQGNMLQNMQQIPPEAHMDFANRLKWVTDFVRKFSEPAAILSKAGHKEFAAALSGWIGNYERLAGTFNSTANAMQAGDAATATAIGNINGQMMRDNAAAAAQRQQIQQGASKFVQDSNDKIMKDRQTTSDRHHDQMSQILKS